MQRIKLSQFVTWWDFEGVRFLYCTKSGVILRVDDIIEKQIKSARYLDDIKNESVRELLVKKGVFVPENLDEFGAFRHMVMVEQFDQRPRRRSFTIAVTEQCMYHCQYCFENGTMHGAKMDDETEDSIINYLLHVIQQGKDSLEEIHISWIGGEPLIALDRIIGISNAVMNACNEAHIQYFASVISNGALIDEEVLSQLLQIGVSFVQITLDGDRDISCLYKGSTPKQFDASVNAVLLAAKHIHVNVRLNTDGKNLDAILRLTDYLFDLAKEKDVLDNITFYLACIDYCGERQTPKWFVDCHDRFLSHLKDLGLRHHIERALPKARYTSCGAVTDSFCFISTDGCIVKCEHHLGNREKAVGHVREGLWFNNQSTFFRDLKVDDKCHICSFYPICRQGCLEKRLDEGISVDCNQFIANIKVILKHLTGCSNL